MSLQIFNFLNSDLVKPQKTLVLSFWFLSNGEKEITETVKERQSTWIAEERLNWNEEEK